MEMKLFLGQYLICVILLLGQLHGCKSCIEKEREALLELKKYLMSKSVEGASDYFLTTWTNDPKTDCCRWEGIECSRTSGRVIGLSVGFMEFKEYSLQNLSLLHPFEEVRSLSLSSGHQYDESEFFNQFNGFFDDVKGYKSLRTLRNLEILDLSSNRFNNSIFPFLNAATSLTTLFLRSNIMEGPFPYKELKDLTNLKLLDLSRNFFHGTIPDLTHLKKLKALDLSFNTVSSSMGFQELNNLTNLEVLSLGEISPDGHIPIEVICKMKNLRELDLSENYLVGQLPLCLGSLNKLRFLDLSSNHFSGNLPSSFSSLESLEYLSLLDNNFTGFFSLNPLANFTKLEVFKLSSISNMVQVETESTWQPKFQLSVVVLSACSLQKIPSFLVYQKNLRLVDLSSNRLFGEIPTWLLVNNTELKVLQLQSNSFSIFQMPIIVHNYLKFFDFSANNICGLFPDNIGRALPNLMHMNGSKNGFRAYFPSSMGDMKNILVVDLSYNNFYGKLPRSFLMGCFSLRYLFLSHNKFNGQVLPEGTNFTSMEVLRMDNNLFTGKIGVGLLSSNNTLKALDLSNNYLTGTIPSWISTISYLDILSLSNNSLEGTIPPSLMNISLLDISGNLLSGALPSHSLSSILFLHNNNFTGVIPDTLMERVKILDLRNNKLSGSIPQFVHTQSIKILLLKGNNFSGSIRSQLCDLSNIRILDLSDNKLSGFIPSCLSNLSFGRGEESRYNWISRTQEYLQFEFFKFTFAVEEHEVNYFTFQPIEIKFATKKRYDSYLAGSGVNKGILDYMYGMDLSSNEFSGVIPVELEDLSIRSLNLSHNFLSSSIPSSFSKLKDIESLDLSHNLLQGSIPQQLTNLNFLAVLDVSYNNLSGIIPQGRHFDTFDEKSYLGNPLLCGPPTNRSCEAKKSTDESSNGGKEGGDEAAIDMVAFYISTASTYVAALIGILVLMCFDCPWRRAWLRIVDAFIASAKSMFS